MNIKKRSGFTLIELLVVVLIIGILAAIALPQYTLAVEKSRAAEPLMILKSIREAAEMYYLANGTYPTDFSALDIQVPQSANWEYMVGGASVGACRKSTDASKQYLLAYRFANQPNENYAENSIVCGYRADECTSTVAAKDFAEKICKTLGAQVGSGDRWEMK